MTEQVPSIGRVVHYMYGDEHYAAIITAPRRRMLTDDGTDISGQAMTVFPPTEPPFTTIALFDAGCAPATWHWPEFVPAKA